MKWISVLIVGLLCCSSCDENREEPDWIYIKSYVQTYAGGSFEVHQYVWQEENDLRIYYPNLNNDPMLYQSPETSPQQKKSATERFLQIAERNGDRTFNRKINFLDLVPDKYFADNFKAVRVVCTDAAWDDQHPAGSLLNDLLTISFESCAEYVHSGYENKYGYESVTKQLSALTESDLTMVKTEIRMHFDQQPRSGIYTLQVTMVPIEGKEKVATCEWKVK